MTLPSLLDLADEVLDCIYGHAAAYSQPWRGVFSPYDNTLLALCQTARGAYEATRMYLWQVRPPVDLVAEDPKIAHSPCTSIAVPLESTSHL